MSRIEELKAALDKQQNDWQQFDERSRALARQYADVMLTRLGLVNDQYDFKPLSKLNDNDEYALRGALEYNDELRAHTFGFIIVVPGHGKYLLRLFVRGGVQERVVGSLDSRNEEGVPFQAVIKSNEDLERFVDNVITIFVDRHRLEYERTIEGLKV